MTINTINLGMLAHRYPPAIILAGTRCCPGEW